MHPLYSQQTFLMKEPDKRDTKEDHRSLYVIVEGLFWMLVQ